VSAEHRRRKKTGNFQPLHNVGQPARTLSPQRQQATKPQSGKSRPKLRDYLQVFPPGFTPGPQPSRIAEPPVSGQYGAQPGRRPAPPAPGRPPGAMSTQAQATGQIGPGPIEPTQPMLPNLIGNALGVPEVALPPMEGQSLTPPRALNVPGAGLGGGLDRGQTTPSPSFPITRELPQLQ
jgi:hypothetical protein